MKCTCGNNRHDNAALCRMVAGAQGGFYVEVYAPSDHLLAKSQTGLKMTEALAFVDEAVGERFNAHFHWEEGGNTKHS